MVQREMSFKAVSILALVAILFRGTERFVHFVQRSGTVSAIWKGAIYYGKHLCEIILNLDLWFRRYRLKIVLF